MDAFYLILVGAAVLAAFAYSLKPLFDPAGTHAALLIDESSGELTKRELARLLMERDHAYKAIRDIEFDNEMGKLSEADYGDMISTARLRAIDVLRRLEAKGVKEGMVPLHVDERRAGEEAERLATHPSAEMPAAKPTSSGSSLDDRLEAEILKFRQVRDAAPDAMSSQTQAARYCPKCGAGVEAGHNFCAACGSKL